LIANILILHNFKSKMSATQAATPGMDPRTKALQDYRKKLLEHREIDAKLKECTDLLVVPLVLTHSAHPKAHPTPQN
jgi:hypothetical protein